MNHVYRVTFDGMDIRVFKTEIPLSQYQEKIILEAAAIEYGVTMSALRIKEVKKLV
jgi:hypothetical protein